MHKTLILAAFAAASFHVLAAIRALTPDMYGGNAKAWQLGRHAEKMNAVTNGGAKVVFVGDSITHFWETTGSEQLKRYFSTGDYRMLNLGFSADRTEHVLWRLTEGRELDGYEAKVVNVMIGTNNTGHFPLEQEAPIDTILGIRKILQVIHAKQPNAKILLNAIFPRGKDVTDPSRCRNEIVNREIAKFADGKTVFWVDFRNQFLLADGRLPREIAPDLLHPGAYGYEIWASAIMPYVSAALEGRTMPPSRYAPFLREEDVRMEGVHETEYPTSRIKSLADSETNWWLSRLGEKRCEIVDAKGKIDLVFFGDSITHNWESVGKAKLDELGKTHSILNLGFGGDRIEHLLWRGEYGGELDGYEAKCVMLMVGTNNSSARHSPEVIAIGVRRLLDLIARKQPKAKVLLLPILPRGDAKDAKRANNEKANVLIKALADGEKVVWVDFNAKFLDANGDTKWIMPDGVHPNAKGYEIWAEAVRPYFGKACGK